MAKVLQSLFARPFPDAPVDAKRQAKAANQQPGCEASCGRTKSGRLVGLCAQRDHVFADD